MNKCIYCSKEISNKGSLVAHEMSCKHNPNKIKHKKSINAGQKKGCIPWNKNKKFQQKSTQRIINLIESGEYKNHSDNNIRKVIKQYLIHKNGHKCMICGFSNWLNSKIPLVTDHIDGNAENNEIENFRIICNNCDATLPTFKGRNKGGGRENRYH